MGPSPKEKLLLCACVLLVGNAVSMPLNMRQNDANVFPQDFATEEQFRFLPPKNIAQPQLFGQQPYSVSKGYDDKSLALEQHSVESSSGKFSKTRIAVGCGVLIVLLVCVFLNCSSEESVDTTPSSARQHDDLTAMDTCDGTWARNYQKAQGQSKQALELLFRCHIIPAEEFADSAVDQETIDECVWIASVMLSQKPLDHWLANSVDAQRTFEESVAACFGSHAQSPLQAAKASHLGETPQGPADIPIPAQSLDHDVDSQLQYSLRAQSDLMAGSVSSVHSDTSLCDSLRSSRSNFPAMLKTPEDANVFLARCRQIMASTDSQRKPWSSMPARVNHGAPASSSQSASEFAPAPKFASLPPGGIPPTRAAEAATNAGGGGGDTGSTGGN